MRTSAKVSERVTAAGLGYRMPAEWEALDAVWVTTPHNKETWPGCLSLAREQFEKMVRAIEGRVEVRRTEAVGITTDDSWIRDYGPLFVVDREGRLAGHDFRFNCWGGKYAEYHHDDLVDKRLSYMMGLRLFEHDFVLEGGSIDVDGCGTVMTTRECMLAPGDGRWVRNRGVDREGVEAVLHGALGTRRVIWLEGGLAGDDTDGHVDCVARFVAPGRVVAVRAGEGSGVARDQAGVLDRNWEILEGVRGEDGGRLELVGLPVPSAMYYDYPADEYGEGGRRRLPASYANFLIANGAVIVPVFGVAEDDEALRVLEGAMPGYEVIGVRCDRLVVGLGGVHCLTMQQPKGVIGGRAVGGGG